MTAGMTNAGRRDWSNRMTAIEKDARPTSTTRTGTRAAATWSGRRVRTAVIGSFSATAVSPTVYRLGPPTIQAVAQVWHVWVPADDSARAVSRSAAP
jgi:hypothetical protein